MGSLAALHPLQIYYLFYLLIVTVVSIRFHSWHNLLLTNPQIVHIIPTIQALPYQSLPDLPARDHVRAILAVTLNTTPINVVLTIHYFEGVFINDLAVYSCDGRISEMGGEALGGLEVYVGCVFADLAMA